MLCVGTATTGDVCFSADELGEVRIWQLPMEINDPFDSYGRYTILLNFDCGIEYFTVVDPKIHQGILKGHTDAVWDLVVHQNRDLLATCSSDGSCKIWNWRSSDEPVLSLSADPGMSTHV